MSYYRPGTVTPKDMAPVPEKGPTMIAAAADGPSNNIFRRAWGAVIATVAAVGFAMLRKRRAPRVVEHSLVVNPDLRLDESVLGGAEWMAWAEKNLSARELELLRLAESSDRGRPVVDAECVPTLAG
jgi:hypothetical protein